MTGRQKTNISCRRSTPTPRSCSPFASILCTTISSGLLRKMTRPSSRTTTSPWRNSMRAAQHINCNGRLLPLWSMFCCRWASINTLVLYSSPRKRSKPIFSQVPSHLTQTVWRGPPCSEPFFSPSLIWMRSPKCWICRNPWPLESRKSAASPQRRWTSVWTAAALRSQEKSDLLLCSPKKNSFNKVFAIPWLMLVYFL